MYTTQQDTLLASLCKQLNITDSSKTALIKTIIQSSRLNDYEDIKLMSKSLKPYLTKDERPIKHSEVINVLSKALGYKNQHSLVKHFQNKTTIKIDIEKDSVIKKMVLLKDDFINQFGIDSWDIGFFTHKHYEFDFIYQKYERQHPRKTKIEINNYLRAYGINPYKNCVSICKIKYGDNIQRIAFNILKYYKSFFTPTWYEQDLTMKNYRGASTEWALLSYGDIKSVQGYLLVDNYSTDLFWNVVKDFLNYIFFSGDLEAIELLEKWSNGENYERETNARSYDELSRLYEYERYKIKQHLSNSRNQNISEAFENMNYKIEIKPYMLQHLKEFEQISKQTIKEILIANCDYFVNKDFTDETIINKLFLDLLNMSKNDYIRKLEQLDGKEYDYNHQKLNCLRNLSTEVVTLIEVWKETVFISQ